MKSHSACDVCDLYHCRDIEAALYDHRRPFEKRRLRVNQPSFAERSAYYIAAIRKAGRYVAAKEIDPKNAICGRGLKYWTLRRMVQLGYLKTFCDGKVTYFTTTNKGDRKCE